jgi:hypothetical protein
MNLEQNIRRAFQGVKKDILEVKDQLLKVAETQEKLMAEFEELKKQTKKPAKKKTSKKKK